MNQNTSRFHCSDLPPKLITRPTFFRVAFKPVATVMHPQDTVDVHFHNTTLKGRGRHDPCVLPRAVPMVEAMTALVLVDHALRHKAQCS